MPYNRHHTLLDTPLIALLQPGNQTRRIPAPAIHRLNISIELVDQRSYRQLCAIAPRLLQDNGEVLTHPIDSKPEIKLAIEHSPVTIFHLPGLSSPLADHGNDRIAIQARALSKMQRLRQPL